MHDCVLFRSQIRVQFTEISSKRLKYEKYTRLEKGQEYKKQGCNHEEYTIGKQLDGQTQGAESNWHKREETQRLYNLGGGQTIRHR